MLAALHLLFYGLLEVYGIDSKQLCDVIPNVSTALKMRKLRIIDTWLAGMDMRYMSGSYYIRASALKHHAVHLS